MLNLNKAMSSKMVDSGFFLELKVRWESISDNARTCAADVQSQGEHAENMARTPPQERIMAESFGGEHFTHSLLLVLCNRLTAFAVAAAALLVTHSRTRQFHPHIITHSYCLLAYEYPRQPPCLCTCVSGFRGLHTGTNVFAHPVGAY